MNQDLITQAARQFGVPPERLIGLLRRASADPVFWIELTSGQKLWSKQREICQSVQVNRVTCVPACNASGKTWTAGGLIAYGISNLEPYLAIATAPTERQVKYALWKEVRNFYVTSRVPLPGRPDLLQWIVSERQRALGFATSDYNPNLFQGIREAKNTRLFLDEACGISADVREGALGIMAAGNARMLQLGNPVDPLTFFREDCENPHNCTIHISAYDTPNFNIPGHELREANFIVSESHPDYWTNRLGPYYDQTTEPAGTVNLPAPYLTTPEFVESIVRTYGTTSPQYVSRVLGRFPEQSDEALFSFGELQEAMDEASPHRAQLLARAAGSPLELGVDVARYGTNLSVIMGWQDPVLRVLDVFSKTDTVQTANRVREMARRCARAGLPPVACKVDVIGVGGGVVDNLAHTAVDWGHGLQDFPVVAFNSAMTEGVPEYAKNVRGHAYLYLKQRLEERTISLPARTARHADQLRRELSSIRKTNPDNNEKTLIYGKEWMRAQGLASPDLADAAVIAVYPGVRPRGDHGITI